MTAEVEPYVCDEAEARELTEAIRGRAEQTWSLIEQAYKHRAWSAMGYESWDAYCSAEFGTTRLRLPREDRSAVVSSLRESGMSLRAIASATGESKNTVQRALAPVPNGTPAPDPLAAKIAAELASSDGDYAAQAAASVEDIADAEIIEDLAPAVTGLDGKTYQSTGRKSPRKPITETAKTRGFALRAATDSLLHVFEDDRYRTNEKQVADLVRGHLLYVAETVAAVLDQLPTN